MTRNFKTLGTQRSESVRAVIRHLPGRKREKANVARVCSEKDRDSHGNVERRIPLPSRNDIVARRPGTYGHRYGELEQGGCNFQNHSNAAGGRQSHAPARFSHRRKVPMPRCGISVPTMSAMYLGCHTLNWASQNSPLLQASQHPGTSA